MRHDNDPDDTLGSALEDRGELVFTSDPYTRLRPGNRGTVTGTFQAPGDSREVPDPRGMGQRQHAGDAA